MVDWPGSNQTCTLRCESGERNWFGRLLCPPGPALTDLDRYRFSFLGNLLFNRWNGSGCIYTTHTHKYSLSCYPSFFFLRQRWRWIACLTLFLFLPPLLCSFPSCYLSLCLFHSGFYFFLTFTPVTLYSTAAELTIYRSSIFPSLFFVGRLLKTRRGKRKESRDVTTLQGEQVLTLSKCRGVPNNTLSPLKLGSYPKVFASPRAALAVGKLFNNSWVRTYHFVNNWIRKSAQMCFNTRNLWVLYRSLGNCLLEISHPRGRRKKNKCCSLYTLWHHWTLH